MISLTLSCLSCATHSANDMALKRRGWVTIMLQCAPRCDASQCSIIYCGTWVLFPQPGSPFTTITRFSSTICSICSLYTKNRQFITINMTTENTKDFAVLWEKLWKGSWDFSELCRHLCGSKALILKQYRRNNNTDNDNNNNNTVDQRHQCHSQSVSTPASYLGGPGFKYWPKDQLFWLRLLTVFLNSSSKCQDNTLTRP
jgi:hypothetical protein